MHHHLRVALLVSALSLQAFNLFSATAPVSVPAAETLDLANPRQPTLFLVGYAHLDTQWRWDYPMTIREFLPDTFNDNFARFEKFPRYVFNFTGASRYKLIKDYYPDAFEKIRAAVAAGRWWPDGVAWEENDANVPSAESQIRQFLLGHEFFLKEFHTESNDFILPDCFGFPSALPSLLAHCGIRGFSTQKLTWGSANGIPFNVGEWTGPDGNSVIAALNALAYGRDIGEGLGLKPAAAPDSKAKGKGKGKGNAKASGEPDWASRVKQNGDASGIYADYTYMGIGDRGGAPKETSVANAQRAITGGGPLRVICARGDLMFNSISDAQMKNLPKYQGALLLTEHSAGVLTSQACMKRWNRANELLADAAERASVAAWLLGAAPYPREKLNGAWQIVLRSQFHDTLPGTCIPKAYEYAWNDEVLCMNTFAEILTGAVGAVASGLDTRAPGGTTSVSSVPLVVYNPLSIAREDVVEATVNLSSSSIQVLDGDGNAVPTQLLSRDGDTCRIAFLAQAPSVGFAVYTAVPTSPTSPIPPASPISVTTRALENPRYRVTLNDAGDIASIFDKQANRELLSAPARLAFQSETPEKNPAWNMDWADRKNPPRGYVGDDASATAKPRIEIVENGPVRVALRVTRQAEHSTFEQTIRLTAASTSGGTTSVSSASAASAADRIEISNTIDWQSKGCSLKAAFPLTVSNPLATYNEDLGKIQRATNDEKKYEVPTHQWLDLTAADNTYGVSILTAAKYGSDKPDDRTLRLTLLYTPSVEKMQKFRFHEQRWQDWGRHEFTYGIYAHAGDWRDAGSDWQALRMEQPLLAFTTTQHDGKLGRAFSLLDLNTDAVAVRAIKLAENSDKIIVRLQELNGAPQTNVSLTTNPAATATLGSVSEVNGVEKVLEGRAVSPKPPKGRAVSPKPPRTARSAVPANDLSLDFQKYQLRTLALSLDALDKLDANDTSEACAAVTLTNATSAPIALPCNINALGHRGQPTAASDGFDSAGATIPAEMLPDAITAEGITFQLAPAAIPAPAIALAQSKIENRKSKISNALRCEGQTIALPAGNFNRVYLLAASADGDTTGKFTVGREGGPARDTTLTVQNWTGYIGSWDNRVFEGEVPELSYAMSNPLARIDAGFIKRDPVAWYCDHRYKKDGTDAIYSYCYLFKYALEVPAGAKTVTLPNNPKIRVFAMTAANDPAAGTRPARPLYDDFTNRKPIVIPKGWANSD